jgi:hypothetical protein
LISLRINKWLIGDVAWLCINGASTSNLVRLLVIH